MDSPRPRVAVVSPSRTFTLRGRPGAPDVSRLDSCVRGLTDLGFAVVQLSGGYRCHRRYGGTDDERAEELDRFLSSSDIDLVLPVRGGYGMERILHRLDFAAARDAGALAMGFSDFTALNVALLAKAGLPSWQGPVAGRFSARDSRPATVRSFLSALTESRWEMSWDAPAGWGGVSSSGIIWGGNLSILSSLVGTPWFPAPDVVEGGMLFVEDVNEPPYRIDRMLFQLAACGCLQSQSAVIFGDFRGTDDMADGEDDLRLCDVVESLAESLAPHGTAVVTGLPFGHLEAVGCVPVGVPGSLDVDLSGRATLATDCAPVIRRGRDCLRAVLASLPPAGAD